MTSERTTVPGDGAHGARTGTATAERSVGPDPMPLPAALRTAAHRRSERASALRAWSRDARPMLARSLRRRAAELELAAVALELRADGMDGGAPPMPNNEEER